MCLWLSMSTAKPVNLPLMLFLYQLGMILHALKNIFVARCIWKSFEKTWVKREECIQIKKSRWQICYFGYISIIYYKKTLGFNASKKKHCIPFLVKGPQASISFPYRSLVTLPFPGMLFSALGKVGSNVSFIL